MKLRVGLIGCGTAAKFFHAPAYRKLEDIAEVVAISDPNIENRDLVARILGNPLVKYDSFEDMVRNENLDMVDIMLPHNLYVKIAPLVADYCCNILMEKPFATNLDDARIISEALKGKKGSVVHNYLYGRRYVDALRRIRSGEIGEPQVLRLENLSRALFYDPHSSFSLTWRQDRSIAGDSTFNDHGYHLVYLARALVGSEVAEVTANMCSYGHMGDVLDPVFVLLRHRSGAVSMLIDGMFDKKSTRVEEIIGMNGSIKMHREREPADYFRQAFDGLPVHEVLIGSPFARSTSECIRDYINAVLEGRNPSVTLDDGLRTLEIVQAAQRAHRENKTIKL